MIPFFTCVRNSCASFIFAAMIHWRYLTGQNGPTGFGSRATASEVAAVHGERLRGKVVVMTGATSGIGVETARVLAGCAQTLVFGARSEERANELIATIRASSPSADVRFLPLDLNVLSSVRAFVAAFDALGLPLDVLINNAGSLASTFTRTADGYEHAWGTNHMAPALLTTLLLESPARPRDAPVRVVHVCSRAHTFVSGLLDYSDVRGERPADASYSWMREYSRSKLAQLYYSNELQRRFGPRVTSVAIHPGFIETSLGRRDGGGGGIASFFLFFTRPFQKSIPQGASTTVLAALIPESEAGPGGKYMEDCNYNPTSALALDATEAAKLYDWTVEALKEFKGETKEFKEETKTEEAGKVES